MSLRTTIHSCLLASTEVLALIGNPDGTLRHYRVRAPQGATRPYLVSQVISSPGVQTHGHATANEDKMAEGRVQFTALADDPDAGAAIILAVRRAFLNSEVTACKAVLDAARIVAVSPDEREGSADEVVASAPQIDISFFHNPQA